MPIYEKWIDSLTDEEYEEICMQHGSECGLALRTAYNEACDTYADDKLDEGR